jgi:hypothetical protein
MLADGAAAQKPAARAAALDALLAELPGAGASPAQGLARSVRAVQRRRLAEPVVHVFSGVTHTMLVEEAALVGALPAGGAAVMAVRWVGSDGREAAWMRAEEMEAVGLPGPRADHFTPRCGESPCKCQWHGPGGLRHATGRAGRADDEHAQGPPRGRRAGRHRRGRQAQARLLASGRSKAPCA